MGLLDPIYRRIREECLKTAKIHADDTPVPMLMPGTGKTATARLWAYVVDDRASGSATSRLVWYRFTQDRGGAHPRRELANFSGVLQADGYAGYDRLYATGRVLKVARWANFIAIMKRLSRSLLPLCRATCGLPISPIR